MDWILTFTGRRFRPLQPDPDLLDVRDIAHSLSLLCRFNGHCLRYYSVAEHSVRVSRILPPDLALWGLLHDAAEAYVSDLPRPVKRQVPAFNDYEDALLRVIAARFGLAWPMPQEVRHADDVLLATERRDLMPPDPAPWGLRGDALPEAIVPLGPEEAERLFLDRFQEIAGR